MPTYRIGEVSVTVDAGSDRSHRVVVRHGRARFATAVDAASGERSASLAALVLEDMLTAASDPEAFVLARMGESTGREALRRALEAKKVVWAARKFSYRALADAVEDARERGLL